MAKLLLAVSLATPTLSYLPHSEALHVSMPTREASWSAQEEQYLPELAAAAPAQVASLTVCSFRARFAAHLFRYHRCGGRGSPDPQPKKHSLLTAATTPWPKP